MIYKKIIRPILFKRDPEKIHNFALSAISIASSTNLFRDLGYKFVKFENSALNIKIAGIDFKNPIGLAAGMDKNCLAPRAWEMLNFGFSEIGSITYNSQLGNPKPRIWRCVKDEALIINSGLNNDGANIILNRLRNLSLNKNMRIGVSIAKNNNIGRNDAVENYLKSFKLLSPYADFIVLNISCPNVACDFEMQEGDFVDDLLKEIQKENIYNKPIFIKIGGENNEKGLEKNLEVCLRNNIAGIVAINSLKKNKPPLSGKNKDKKGGLSGRPIRETSDKTIASIYSKTKGKLSIIGVGGIFTAEDAYRKIKLGASLIESAAGFVYEGPLFAKKISMELVKLLERDGFKNISEAVGVENTK